VRGATAWSGGWMWIPQNPLSQADGIIEDPELPRTYLKNVLGDRYDETRVAALLDAGPHMVAFFEKRTALQFVSGTWIADIQGHVPGAGTGGRSVGPKPYNGRKLSQQLRAKLRPQLYETSFLGMGIMAGPDLQAFLHATRSAKGLFHASWRVAFHLLDLAVYRQGMQLVNGPALIARLLRSADDLGVQPPGQEVASWLICDHAFQRRYPFGMSEPFPVPVWPYLRSGYLKRGRTLEELAGTCGIDPVGLARTVEEFNRRARGGEDPLFGRGSTPFNRGSGDPDHKPNPSLAPIERPPFYAIKVLPGSFGTFAGLRTDAQARVLTRGGDPVPGLYAVGSDQANVMGGYYPSGGINIGPAMTFGYIAGRHIAGAVDYENLVPAARDDGI
jgi:succinate dehydrogenase/fumarate reductase flavoprotein subunit